MLPSREREKVWIHTHTQMEIVGDCSKINSNWRIDDVKILLNYNRRLASVLLLDYASHPSQAPTMSWSHWFTLLFSLVVQGTVASPIWKLLCHSGWINVRHVSSHEQFPLGLKSEWVQWKIIINKHHVTFTIMSMDDGNHGDFGNKKWK